MPAFRSGGVVAPRSSFTMAELVQRSGVPRATIHSYARRGLLPPPQRPAPNRFLYDERHVRALHLVRLLRDRRGLGLDEIADVLPELLGDDREEAFEPGLWEQAVGVRLAQLGDRGPGRRLLRAGIALYAERGLAETSIDDLCRHADIAKGSFYQHFASKEELLFAATRTAAEDAVAACSVVSHGAEVDGPATAKGLAEALRDGLPLLLDVTAGAVRGRHGYAESLGEVRRVVVEGLRAAAVGTGLELEPDHALAIARDAIGTVVEDVVSGTSRAAGAARGA